MFLDHAQYEHERIVLKVEIEPVIESTESVVTESIENTEIETGIGTVADGESVLHVGVEFAAIVVVLDPDLHIQKSQLDLIQIYTHSRNVA